MARRMLTRMGGYWKFLLLVASVVPHLGTTSECSPIMVMSPFMK